MLRRLAKFNFVAKMKWKTLLVVLSLLSVTFFVSQYVLVVPKAESVISMYEDSSETEGCSKNSKKSLENSVETPGGCGHGCLIHHIGVCLFLAVGTNRTLQLQFDTPVYSKELLEIAYRPLSETCNDVDRSELKTAPEIQGNGSHETTNHYRTVKLNVKGAFDPFTSFAPLTIPTQLKSALKGLHDVPHHWWIGHVLAYVTRLQPTKESEVESLKKNLGFSNTTVGVHIRRSDKLISEAKSFTLEDYMCHVTDLSAKTRTGQSEDKNVFLATDDPDIYSKAKQKFPFYNFLTIHENSKSAALHRETEQGFLGIVQDIQLLSDCQDFVGTLSSNVGRLVYALMLAKTRKDSFTVCTLDDGYMYYGSVPRYLEAMAEHIPTDENNDEIQLQLGDQVYVNPSRLMCNRRCFGTNSRTRKTGYFPAEKIREYANPVLYQGFQWDESDLL